MLISQTVSPLVTPSLREAMLFGGARRDWERLFDQAATVRHDDAVQRALESEARREEQRRKQERAGIHCAPAPVAARVGRPHVFYSMFSKNIGGVSGVSDVWCDASFVAVDGGSGKLQSWVDYVDNTHLLTQATSGKQAPLPSAAANLGTALAADFTGTGPQTEYVSNRAVTRSKYLTDGTGGELTVVLENIDPSSFRPIAHTHDLTGLHNGMRIFGQTANVRATIEDGTTTRWNTSNVGSAGTNVSTYLTYAYSATTTPKAAFYQKSTLLYSTDPTGSASAADPQLSLTLGWSPGANIAGTFMKVRSLYTWRHILNAAERIVRGQWIQRDTGVTP